MKTIVSIYKLYIDIRDELFFMDFCGFGELRVKIVHIGLDSSFVI